MSEEANAGAAAPTADVAQGEERENLVRTRRRLSVVSDNKLVEGLSGLATEEEAATEGQDSAANTTVQQFAGVSKKGYAPYNPRKKNQDAIIMMEDEATRSLLLCTFDGHGEAGDSVAQFFKRELPRMLFAHEAWATDVERSVTECVAALEARLLADSSVDTEFSGTTANMCVVRDGELIVGNIGDSRCTVATEENGAMVAVAVSDDHKPNRPDEEARIVAAGGRVFAVEYDDGVDGPPRVWLGHMDVPGLAMSRSLGDTVAHSAGVSSEPEWTRRTLTAADKAIVTASDGLWEFMSDQEVVDLMLTCDEPRRAVDALIMEANSRWMREEQVIDDTSVVVAYLATAPAAGAPAAEAAPAPAASS